MPQATTQKTSLNSLKRTISRTKKKLLTAYTRTVIGYEKKLLSLIRQQNLLKETINTLKETKTKLSESPEKNKIKIEKIRLKTINKKHALKQIKEDMTSTKKALSCANKAYKKICHLQRVESNTINQLNKPKAIRKKSIKTKTAKKILKEVAYYNELTPNLFIPILPSTRPHNKPQSIWNPLPTKSRLKKPKEDCSDIA